MGTHCAKSVDMKDVFLDGDARFTRSLRVVHISDTHNALRSNVNKIPYGDVLVHSGDFTDGGSKRELDEFFEVFVQLPHPYKVFIAGNHELTLDKYGAAKLQSIADSFAEKTKNKNNTHIVYLEDSAVVIQGVKFYGSPWNNIKGQAFGCDDAYRAQMFNLVHRDTDIMITHNPPHNIRDKIYNGQLWGDKFLAQYMNDSTAALHLFGHVHERVGITEHNEKVYSNGAMAEARIDRDFNGNYGFVFNIHIPTNRPKVDRFPLYHPSTVTTDNTVLISNKGTGLVFDVDCAKEESGTPIILYKPTHATNQKWTLQDKSGSTGSCLVSQLNGLVADANTHSSENELCMYASWGGLNQKWHIADGHIRSCMDGRYLGVCADRKGCCTPCLVDEPDGDRTSWEFTPC